ncbi:hypothetical protein ACOMHN_052551 [Nucella lapillus]
MAPVKIKFVVSFSSQDKNHKASNVLEESGASARRWLTDPQDRSGQIDAVFQLERPGHLAYIDVGVIWCASVEVRVGKSDWPQGHSYVTLVPTQVLMSSVDSRLSRNFSRTCMFSKAHFTQEGTRGLSSWDRIQVIGRQPWRKDVQLGLSFIRIRCHDSLDVTPNGCKAASDAEGVERKILSVTDMKQHFFGNKKEEKGEDAELRNRLQKIAATAEGVTANPNVMSRNARMVLLANRNAAKPASPEDNPLSTQDSAPANSEEQETSVIAEEVTSFLDTLGIGKEDIESLKVSDLRHKFEKLKWRKLTYDEKRTFYNCCQDFIGRLFDDETSEVSSSGSTTTNNTAVVDCSPQDKHRKATKKASEVTNSSSHSKHRVLTDKDNQEHGNSTPKICVGGSKNDIKVSVDGKSSKWDQNLSGGFLTSVFSRTNVQRDTCMQNITPDKNGNINSKPQSNRGHKTNTSSPSSHTSSTPKQTSSKRKTVSPSENLSSGQNSNVSQNGKIRTGDLHFHADKLHSERKSKAMSPKRSSLPDKHLSPAPEDSVVTSRIDKSLLGAHRQFVKGRLENISLSRSSKPGPSSTVMDSSVDHEHLSGELESRAESSSGSSHRGQSLLGKGSQKSGKKRQGSPVSMLENLNPAKQQPRYCSTPKRQEDVSLEMGGGWLNAKRDGCGSHSRDGSGRRPRGGRSGSRTKEESSPSLESVEGRPKGGNRRGRGGRVARRRLEMPTASTTSRTPTATPSTSGVSADNSVDDDRNDDDPFRGELQIDENAVFVECPMCGEMFPSDTVNTHAADCPGKQAVGGGPGFVQCPLCEDMYTEDVITQHASQCRL